MKRRLIFIVTAFLLIGITGFVIADNNKTCITEPGKAIYPGTEKCCGNLKSIFGSELEDGTCWCTDIENICLGAPICAPCGNGICENEYGEDRCNCPEDCEGKICCHIYGYGNQMSKVNSQYQWIEKTDCVVPEDFVGGGREIVDNALCEEYRNTIRVRERIRANYADETECPEDCTCTGSTTKCNIEGGREMTIRAGNSGNTIIQVKGVDMSTKVELYKNEDGTLFGKFKGIEKEIKILPDQVRERIRERLRQATCECDDIKLDEDGIYQVQAQKRARLFLMIPVKEKVKLQLNSETGEIIRTRTSWWGFLARDVKED